MKNSYKFWYMLYSIILFKEVSKKKEMCPVSILLIYDYLLSDKVIKLGNNSKEIRISNQFDDFLLEKYLYSEIDILIIALNYYYENIKMFSDSHDVKIKSLQLDKIKQAIKVGEKYEY